jgi:hypothetical protein
MLGVADEADWSQTLQLRSPEMLFDRDDIQRHDGVRYKRVELKFKLRTNEPPARTMVSPRRG